jgi:hypothetical protein
VPARDNYPLARHPEVVLKAEAHLVARNRHSRRIRASQRVSRHCVEVPVFVPGMAEHAPGHPPASLTVAGTLKFPVAVGISMQYLDGLVLARPASASTPRQQE